MAGFSLKKLPNGAYLVKRSSVGNNRNTINKPSGFLPPSLDTSRKSHNTRISTYIDNNNLY